MCGTTQADPVRKYGSFWIQMGGEPGIWNEVLAGGGDGYPSEPGLPGGEWYAYENPFYEPGSTPPPGEAPTPASMQGPMYWIPGWVNEWWWDHPYDPDRWKEVHLNFDYRLTDVNLPGRLEIVINWTTPEWTDPDDPPMTNDQIGRQLVRSIDIPAGQDPTGAPFIYNFDEIFDLRDWDINYNPEWISVDVAGWNFWITQQEPGSITHACVDVPEPVSMALLVSGLTGLGVYVRRRRRA
jgi:hypothetical protein